MIELLKEMKRNGFKVELANPEVHCSVFEARVKTQMELWTHYSSVSVEYKRHASGMLR